MMRIAAFLAVVLLAAAPALAQGADPYAQIRSVAVVSLLGDDLVMKDPGGMFDSGSPDVLLDTGADLDGLVVAQVREALGGRFAVVDGPVDPALLAGYPVPARFMERLRPRLGRAQTGAPPDALIVVYPTTNEISLDQPYFTAHAYYQGLSMTHSTGGLLNRTSGMLSAQFALAVIDARTGQKIGAGRASLEPRALLFGRRPIPIAFCDEGFWPQSPARPTEAEMAQIRIDFTGLVARSLPNALYDARLVAHGVDEAWTSWNGHPLACR